MNDFSVTGSVLHLGDTQTRGTQDFKVREFVCVVSDGEFEQFIKFEVTGKNVGILDHIRLEDKVEVNFNLRGREWTDPNGVVKYFTNLIAWKVNVTQEAPKVEVSQQVTATDDDEEVPF